MSDPMREKIQVFTRKNGKVIATEKPRFVQTGKQQSFKGSKAKMFISQEISNMASDIKQSTKSDSLLVEKKNSYDFSHRVYQESTFPDWYRTLNLSNKKDFDKIAKSKKGVRYERVKKIAIDRLNNGYQNSHGWDVPNTDFKVATGKLYDNKNIIFRRIRGKIRPLRIAKRNRFDLMEEAPF